MKNVLVTGASRGIGKAIADIYNEAGYKVFVPSREEMDLSSRKSIRQYMNENSHQKYHILINNAGCNEINQIENISESETDQMINVNLLAPLFLMQFIVPGMKEEKFGRIVNISSIWGVVSKAKRTVYSATKHGIHGLTVSLSIELAPYNILVNTVAPGNTMTDLTRKNNTPEEIQEMAKLIPVGRLADPTEIAKAVFFLGNEENTYITGQKLVVDGGFSIQ